MLQPFVSLEQQHIDRLEKLGNNLLVTQTYTRGLNHAMNERDRTDILISDYSNAGLANIHANAVKQDAFGAVIDLKKVQHYQKLVEMLQGNKYRLYWAVIASEKDVKKVLNTLYKAKVRNYITAHTNWRIAGNDALAASELEVIFGELYLNLKWQSQRHRAELSEIEKY